MQNAQQLPTLTSIESKRKEESQSEVLVCSSLWEGEAIQETKGKETADLLASQSYLLNPSFVQILYDNKNILEKTFLSSSI